MPPQIRQTRLSELSWYKVMRTGTEEVWTESEETRTAVRGALAVGSAFRAFWKACKTLREIIQAVWMCMSVNSRSSPKLGT